jgi:hypothetical protein
LAYAFLLQLPAGVKFENVFMKVERDVNIRRAMGNKALLFMDRQRGGDAHQEYRPNCRFLAALGGRDSHHRSNLREDGADAGRDTRITAPAATATKPAISAYSMTARIAKSLNRTAQKKERQATKAKEGYYLGRLPFNGWVPVNPLSAGNAQYLSGG